VSGKSPADVAAKMVEDMKPPVAGSRGHFVASLGLSDLPENAEKEARKVVFAVGDLSFLDETRNAWTWAVNSLLHKDDNLFVVHCRPPLDALVSAQAGAAFGHGAVLSPLYAGLRELPDDDSTWLPGFIRDDLMRMYHAHRTVLLKLPPGTDTGEALVAHFARERADIVIMGARDMGVPQTLLLGSTTKYIVANCHCPCVVIRRPLSRGVSGGAAVLTRPRHVVMALNDNEELGRAVVKWAVDNVLVMADRVTVVSCVDADYQKPLRRSCLNKFAEGIHSFKNEHKSAHFMRSPIPDVHTQVLQGSPGKVITEGIESAEPKVDLLIVGSRGLKGLRRLACGSVSTYFLDNVASPVCIVRRDLVA